MSIPLPIKRESPQEVCLLHDLTILCLFTKLATTFGQELALFCAVLEQTSGAAPEIRTCLQWLSAFQPLRAFLNAVACNPAAFVIPLVARTSILDSLQGDHANQSLVTHPLALAPVAWAINAMVWRMHCNYLRAMRHTNIIANFDMYLYRAAASMKHANDNHKPFSASPPVLNLVLPVLRPPRPKNWLEGKFRLQPYANPICAPPLASDFWIVKVTMTQGTWQPLLLETKDEFEEQLTMQNPSPDSLCLLHHMQQLNAGGMLDHTGVCRTLFTLAHDAQGTPFQFHTGSPPDHPLASLLPAITDLCSREQRQILQDTSATSHPPGDSYDG
jgi:hypothetical protein